MSRARRHELPSHAAFGRLRLTDYVNKDETEPRTDWEYRGRVWTGEGHGFTDFLCPEEKPSTVRCICVDLAELPAAALRRLLSDLGLPLEKGMTQNQVDAALGKPVGREVFVPDRATSEYALRGPPGYGVSCTIRKKGGLAYLTMRAL